MNPKFVRGLRLALVPFAFVASMILAGCSENPAVTAPKTSKAIPHSRADDIVQLIATTLSSDNGGWYCVVKAMCETLAVAAPAPSAAQAAFPGNALASNPVGTLSQFNLQKAGMTYFVQVGWVRSDGLVTTTRTTQTRSLRAYVVVDGGSFYGANGVNGTYGMQTYALNSVSDSLFVVGNLASIDPDTLEFNGFLNDSTFSVVQSTIGASAGRLWYHTNFVDYNIRIPKSRLRSGPYPVFKDSEIHWTIDATENNGSLSRTDTLVVSNNVLGARMTFNGTAEGVLVLNDNSLNPKWSYSYRVNLNTGQIARLD